MAAVSSPRRERISSGIPPFPPASVLAQVAAAHERMGELAAAGVDVAFEPSGEGGSLTIRLRSPRGDRALRPSEIFTLLAA